MPSADANDESGSLLAQIAHALHDVCQPLTALQCRLEIDQMEREMEDPADTNRTGAECLRECERLNQLVSVMRSLVHRGIAAEKASQV